MRYRIIIVMLITALLSPANLLSQSIIHDNRVAQFKMANGSKKPVSPKSSRRRKKRSTPKKVTKETKQEKNDNAIRIIPNDSNNLQRSEESVVNNFPPATASLKQDVSTATDSSMRYRIVFQNINNRASTIQNANAIAGKQLDMSNAVGSRTDGSFTIGNFGLSGVREKEEYPLLLTTQRLNMETTYKDNHLTLTAGINVNRYFAIGITTQYGVHGAITYSLSKNISMTAFGEYYNVNPWYYMAAFPYISTSRYGGYITYRSKKFGTHIGAEKYYDPFVRQWIFRPIVTPFVKVSDKFIFELPIGGLLKEGSEHLFHQKRRKGPTITPDL